jgi:anti-anti-sigma factor
MNPPVQVIQPAGILDGIQAEQFERAIDEAITAGAQTILVDCQDLTFMDSSGLGALILALKAIRATGGSLCICSINAQIDQLFRLTDTHQIFQVFADRPEFERTLSA